MAGSLIYGPRSSWNDWNGSDARNADMTTNGDLTSDGWMDDR